MASINLPSTNVSRHNDHLLGGEDLVSLIEADAAAASVQRIAEKAAI